MSRVATNKVSLAYAEEATPGVLPGSPVWKKIEPNSIDTFGATIATVSRNPISANRQRQKGTITDLDSAVEVGCDLTMEHAKDFMSAFCFADYNGYSKGPWGPQQTNDVTAVTATGYTVDAAGDVPQYYLIVARGFTNSENNGLKVVGAASTATEIKTSGLVAEASPPDDAKVEVCGKQGATSDLEIDADGNLISTLEDFTDWGLTVGQVIYIGGTAAANQFAESANRGLARVTAITATKLTLDKKATTFVVDDGDAKDIQVFFGQFLRNVAVDDADYVERSFHFEADYPDLEGIGTPGYEYSTGNYANQMSFALPLTDKATTSFGFIGLDTEVPTDTQKTGADSPIYPNEQVAFNTSADIARLRVTEVDETGLTTYFKSLTFTLNNNVSPEKVLGTLGAAFMNVGNLEVNLEAQVLFTNKDVLTAIRNNTTVTMDFCIENEDGAIFVDIPSMTLGGGDKEYPENETVLVNIPGEAFEDATLGTSLGISLFPYFPQS